MTNCFKQEQTIILKMSNQTLMRKSKKQLLLVMFTTIYPKRSFLLRKKPKNRMLWPTKRKKSFAKFRNKWRRLLQKPMFKKKKKLKLLQMPLKLRCILLSRGIQMLP